jgi:hypothetical protein
MNPEKNITPDIEQELPQNEPELLMPQPEIPTISPEELQKQEIEAEQNDKQELEITRRELGLDADQKPGETKPEKVEVAIPVEQTRAPEDITRRNFIGTTLKALGAFFIGSEITKGNETKEDRDPTDPKYREGVEALRGYAKKNGPEHACYYIKKNKRFYGVD